MPFTLDDLADDARTVLRACGIGSATVLGLSMGGMVAQELALRHPDAVQRLVLVGTRPPIPSNISADLALYAPVLLPPPRNRPLAEHLRDRWSGHGAPGFAHRHPEAIEEIVTALMERRTPRVGGLQQARAIMAWGGGARQRRISAPTVVVHGELDRFVVPGNGSRLAGLIPDARHVAVPEVGHLVPYEAGDVLLDVLLE